MRQDLPLAFVNSVIRPFAARSNTTVHMRQELGHLAREVRLRHDAFKAHRADGSVQLSFSCMSAWINKTYLSQF